MKIDIGKNFGEIVKQLEKNGMKTSTIATEIGYTTTTQLYNTIEGRSLLSTKAILRMIDNLDVNPTYIFFGEGNMFLSEETELDKLKKEIKKLNQDKNEIVETVMKLHEMIKTLEQRNDDLIEISKGIIRNFEKKHTQQHSDLEVEKKEEVTKTQ